MSELGPGTTSRLSVAGEGTAVGRVGVDGISVVDEDFLEPPREGEDDRENRDGLLRPSRSTLQSLFHTSLTLFFGAYWPPS